MWLAERLQKKIVKKQSSLLLFFLFVCLAYMTAYMLHHKSLRSVLFQHGLEQRVGGLSVS